MATWQLKQVHSYFVCGSQFEQGHGMTTARLCDVMLLTFSTSSFANLSMCLSARTFLSSSKSFVFSSPSQ
jgi:hypothetical protein